MTGGAPSGGVPVDLTYSGTTDITGPARVTVPEGDPFSKFFQLHVSPCAFNPPCYVTVSAQGKSATLKVNP